MTAHETDLWCSNAEQRLWVRPASANAMHWTPVSEANGVRSMATAGGNLWCAAQGQLWYREPVKQPAHWTSVGAIGGVTAMAGIGDDLYACTTGNNLVTRPADPAAPKNWARVATNVPPGVLAMASDGATNLWVATSANRLLTATV
jgi:hypothetical protein